MPAFNDLNDVPCSANRKLLRDILRRDWGFNGVTVSDSNAIAECVEQGKVSTDVLDKAVGEVLRLKFELGLFDHPYRRSPERARRDILRPEGRALARAADFVLLDGEDATAQVANCDVILAAVGETKELNGEAASRADTGKPVVAVVFSGRPLFPFGFRLRYTGYEYNSLQVEVKAEQVTASVVVKNTGEQAGDEIVQCCVRDLFAKRVRPVKQLVDFGKIHLEPGEERLVTFVIPWEKLGYYDSAMNFVVEPGRFDLFVGDNFRDCVHTQFVL